MMVVRKRYVSSSCWSSSSTSYDTLRRFFGCGFYTRARGGYATYLNGMLMKTNGMLKKNDALQRR
ncbi:unnamed protein product [Trifolium pratense]|uniref:Uncharacterized protein n=1 Tax=Trifolium pratense TaxID=57577 RepID=A0ACB0M0I1_TRIPR|nr:unnamed protein product [Trifolium pratense]